MPVLDNVLTKIPPKLFHGTCEEIVGSLHPSGYDSVFWTAGTPAVAQTYIPVSGGSTLASISKGRRVIEPTSVTIAVASALGIVPDAEYDDRGRLLSWCWRTRDGASAELGTDQVLQYLEGLGYTLEDHNIAMRGWLKVRIAEGKDVILPADYKEPGRVFVLEPPSDLRLYDHLTGLEGDLTDLAYHKIDLFRQLESQGYDGIAIHDFCQSSTCGNVGHVSYGLFAQGLARARVLGDFQATHYEWSPQYDGELFTREYVEWEQEWGQERLRVPCALPGYKAYRVEGGASAYAYRLISPAGAEYALLRIHPDRPHLRVVHDRSGRSSAIKGTMVLSDADGALQLFDRVQGGLILLEECLAWNQAEEARPRYIARDGRPRNRRGEPIP
ncbi:MAG: hypothetical protein CVV05_00200 [Gammaproteobacteria bacterium HGW-Gammaproteobacteria-1]|jgi:hypothetical protein|nr:MAG: hypothetical protein CVV05_00200 [Gammaproteobacteria bacterium HGW-Gammaproteobacteria-1]